MMQDVSVISAETCTPTVAWRRRRPAGRPRRGVNIDNTPLLSPRALHSFAWGGPPLPVPPPAAVTKGGSSMFLTCGLGTDCHRIVAIVPPPGSRITHTTRAAAAWPPEPPTRGAPRARFVRLVRWRPARCCLEIASSARTTPGGQQQQRRQRLRGVDRHRPIQRDERLGVHSDQPAARLGSRLHWCWRDDQHCR